MQLRDFFVRMVLVAKTNYQQNLAVAIWLKTQRKVPNNSQLAAILKQPLCFADTVLTQVNSQTATKKYEKNCRNGGLLCILDDQYPQLLLEGYRPPLVLFYRGKVELLNGLTLAVVGSRRHSLYAHHTVEHLLVPLIKRNFCIVSGMALGVDSLAHRTCLLHGGKTIAVVGSGLDITYPKQHQELQRLLEQTNLVISEYPAGTPVERHHFPNRNRIIANLAYATLVVEAKRRSGSLITANIALDNNRRVLAVPGLVTQPFADGTNALIKAGATLVDDYTDILTEYIVPLKKTQH